VRDIFTDERFEFRRFKEPLATIKLPFPAAIKSLFPLVKRRARVTHPGDNLGGRERKN
jgi:hypothetical protein